jgi:hypothetical protein
LQSKKEFVNTTWNEAIDCLISEFDTHESLLKELRKQGATIESCSSISGWKRDIIGPRDKRTLKAVLDTYGNYGDMTKSIYSDMEHIRNIHQDIGRMIAEGQANIDDSGEKNMVEAMEKKTVNEIEHI